MSLYCLNGNLNEGQNRCRAACSFCSSTHFDINTTWRIFNQQPVVKH